MGGSLAAMARRQVRLAVDPIAEAVRNWQQRGWGSPAHLAAALSLGRAEGITGSAAQAVLEPLGLTMSRHEMLMLLYFSVHGELPLGKMGDRLMIHATSVTPSARRRLPGNGPNGRCSKSTLRGENDAGHWLFG